MALPPLLSNDPIMTIPCWQQGAAAALNGLSPAARKAALWF